MKKTSTTNILAKIFKKTPEKKDPPLDHEKHKNEENKYDKYFNENL